MVGDCSGDVSTLDEGGVVAFGFDCGASTLVEDGVVALLLVLVLPL